MDCSLAGGLLVLNATIGGLLEAADVALNSSTEAQVTRGKAKNGCCVARNTVDRTSGPCGSSFPQRLLLVEVRLADMDTLSSQAVSTNLCNAQ